MALPCGTTGSLYPSFDPARLVSLTVKPASTIALYVRLPSGLSGPLKASDTLLEATTPVKLPSSHCLPSYGIRHQARQGRYFNVGSPRTSVPGSAPPAYATHAEPSVNGNL
jgi:hypothetical protein